MARLGPLLAAASLSVVAVGHVWADGAATEGPDSATADASAPASASAPTNDPISAFLATWFARVNEAQDSQPRWMTPVATVTPRLEEEFRYDQLWETLGNGASVDNYDGGKGLELIPTTSNEILINLPPYEDRARKKPATGFGDWPFLTVKQRFLSANEDNGNYILSGFLSLQAPSGTGAFTNDAWVITPTLAGGKGWGDFDIQATVGVPFPFAHERVIGTSVVTNIAFQFHLWKVFWPEFEINSTYWANGERGGKTQVFLTPGLVLGRFPLGGRVRGIVGVGYQIAVSPKLVTSPALTPTYDHVLIVTSRLAF